MSEVNPQKLIAAMVQKGMTVPEIAAFMKITQAEVKKYVTPQQAPASARHQRDHITPKATVADHKQNNQSFDDLLSEMSKIIDGNKPRQTGKGPATSTVQPKAPNPNKPASTVSFSAQQQALYDQDDTDGRGLFNSISDRLKRSRGSRDTDQGTAPDRVSARFFNNLDDRANRNWRRLPLSRTGNVLKATGGLLNKAAAVGTASFLNKELGVLGHVMTHRIGWLRKGREFQYNLHHLKHHYGLKDENVQDYMNVHGDPHYYRGRGGRGGFDPKSVQSLVLALDNATSKVVDRLRETTDILRRIRIDDDSGLNQNPNAKVMGGLEEKKGGILKRVGLGVAGVGLAGLLASLFSSSAEAHNLGPVTGGDDPQPTRTNPDAPSPDIPAQEQPTQEDQAAKENVERTQENAEQNAPQPTKNDELTFKADKIVFDADDIEFVNKNGGTNAHPQAQTPAGVLGGQKGTKAPQPTQTPNAAPGASQGSGLPHVMGPDATIPDMSPSGSNEPQGGDQPSSAPQGPGSPPQGSGLPHVMGPDAAIPDMSPTPSKTLPPDQRGTAFGQKFVPEVMPEQGGSFPNGGFEFGDGSKVMPPLPDPQPARAQAQQDPVPLPPPAPNRTRPLDFFGGRKPQQTPAAPSMTTPEGGPSSTLSLPGMTPEGDRSSTMTLPKDETNRPQAQPKPTTSVRPSDKGWLSGFGWPFGSEAAPAPSDPMKIDPKPVDKNFFDNAFQEPKAPAFTLPSTPQLRVDGDKITQLSTEMNDPVQMTSLNPTPNQSTSNPNPFSTNGFGANMRDDPPSTFHADHFSDVPGLNRSGREEGIGA
jgi:hypothetical protein